VKSGGLGPAFGLPLRKLWGLPFSPSGAPTNLLWLSSSLSVGVHGSSQHARDASTPSPTLCFWILARCPGAQARTSIGKGGRPHMSSSVLGWTRTPRGLPRLCWLPHALLGGRHALFPSPIVRQAVQPRVIGLLWRGTRHSCPSRSPCLSSPSHGSPCSATPRTRSV
jgi:hypothetical protein